MARPEYDIAVIGGGSGGLTVAAGAAQLGAKVALVERDRLGGDCLWHGCVPSKTLIKSARVAWQMRNAARWSLTPTDPRPDLARVMERVAGVIKEIQPSDSQERFRALGVDVVSGTGRFISRDAIEADGRRLTARTFVIATGSRPTIPRLPGIDTTPYLTNETVFDLREPVPSLLVIGAGPIGSEMAQAFRRLGSEVTVVDVAPQILPREDRDLAAIVAAQMATEGVQFHLGASILGFEGRSGDVRATIRTTDGTAKILVGSHLLLAVGRTPNLEGLSLDAADVELDRGRILLADGLRTTNPRVYVVGDAAGGQLFTHLAEHHAGVVLRNALFRMQWVRPSAVVPWCTFTDPELARVGLSETEAKTCGAAYRVYRFGFSDIDRARIESESEGFAKIITSLRGKLLGAAIVGPHAGELIGEYALALSKGLRARDISGVIHTYPTFAQINRRVADQRMKEGLTPVSRRWIQRIFGLRGAHA